MKKRQHHHFGDTGALKKISALYTYKFLFNRRSSRLPDDNHIHMSTLVAAYSSNHLYSVALNQHASALRTSGFSWRGTHPENKSTSILCRL